MKKSILLLALALPTLTDAQSIRPIWPMTGDSDVRVSGVAATPFGPKIAGESFKIDGGNVMRRAFFWTGGELQAYSGLAAKSYTQLAGLSEDGTRAAGTADDSAFALNDNGTPNFFAGTLGDSSQVAAMAGNGKSVAGTAYASETNTLTQFLWKPDSGATEFTDLSIEAFSADGTVVTGAADFGKPARKIGAASVEMLSGSYAFSPHIKAVSPDGTALVGDEWTDDYHQDAWRWNETGGKTELPSLTAGNSFKVAAANADCTVVFGTDYDPAHLDSPGTAVVWTETSGTVSLKDFVAVDTTGWVFSDAEALSTDGKLFAGAGTLNGRSANFVMWIDGALPSGPTHFTSGPTPTPEPKPSALTIHYRALPKTTAKASLVISGTATDATRVEYKCGKTNGKTPVRNGKWKFKTKLVLGRNVVQFRAVGPGGAGAWKKAKVVRK